MSPKLLPLYVVLCPTYLMSQPRVPPILLKPSIFSLTRSDPHLIPSSHLNLQITKTKTTLHVLSPAMSSSDIPLPNDHQPKPTPPAASSQKRRRIFPNLWHLKCVAIILVLASSGLVTITNLLVVLFSALYLLILSTYSFPMPPSPTTPVPPFFPNSRILPIYAIFTGLAGLLLPILYITAGIYFGDNQGVAATASHLFLLASQVVMEGVTAAAGRFSIPVWAFVPVFYNSCRMPAVAEWARWEVMTSAQERGGAHWMVYVGRGLAILNLGVWSFNLFGFLLPVFLPRAFKTYYSTILVGSKVE